MGNPNLGKSKTASNSATRRPKKGGVMNHPGVRRPKRPSKMMKEVGPC